MSMRPIEAQITTFHKSSEAGVQQNQLNQKPIHEQNMLNRAAEKEIIQERHSLPAADEAAKTDIHKDEGRSERKQQEHAGRRRRARASEEETASVLPERKDHPFKGRHIDLSL